jgi:hypothetical protein
MTTHPRTELGGRTSTVDGHPVLDRRLAAYLDGREARWQAVYEQAITEAGSDPRLRLLAVFHAGYRCAHEEGLYGVSFSPAMLDRFDLGPEAIAVVARHYRTLRERLGQLARQIGAADRADELADRLLGLFTQTLVSPESASPQLAEDIPPGARAAVEELCPPDPAHTGPMT